MSYKNNYKDYCLKRINRIYFIKRIFYYYTFIAPLFIWFYPYMSVLFMIISFYACVECGEIGRYYQRKYMIDFPTNVEESLLKIVENDS